MPELPEVDAARVLAQGVARGRRILGVVVAADPIVFADPPSRVRRRCSGAACAASDGPASISGSSWTSVPGSPCTSG